MEENYSALKVQRILSLVTLLAGIILIIYMIAVEGELGALPLVLLLGGVVWSLVINYKIKLRSRG